MCLQFGTELVFQRDGGYIQRPRLLCTPWSHFEFFPGHSSILLFAQKGSRKILAAQLPLHGPPAAAVHQFGELRGLFTWFWTWSLCGRLAFLHGDCRG